MSELVDFLTQRLYEDEAVARAATPGPWEYDDFDGTVGDWNGEHDGRRTIAEPYLPRDGKHIARHDPARVLREVTAKRTILALHSNYNDDHAHLPPICEVCHDYERHDAERWPCPTLRALAAPFSDHPDFQEQWR